jgi:mRNA interferase HigB
MPMIGSRAFQPGAHGFAQTRNSTPGWVSRMQHPASLGQIFMAKAEVPLVPTSGTFPLVPQLGTCYLIPVQVIAKKALRDFWQVHPKAKKSLIAWHKTVSKADWYNSADIKQTFRSADFVGDSRVIFDVGGNKYRIVAHVAYKFKKVLIKFVGTHKQYEDIDPKAVQ